MDWSKRRTSNRVGHQEELPRNRMDKGEEVSLANSASSAC